MENEYNFSELRNSNNKEELEKAIKELKRLNSIDLNKIRMIQDMIKTRRIQREYLEKRLKELKKGY